MINLSIHFLIIFSVFRKAGWLPSAFLSTSQLVRVSVGVLTAVYRMHHLVVVVDSFIFFFFSFSSGVVAAVLLHSFPICPRKHGNVAGEFVSKLVLKCRISFCKFSTSCSTSQELHCEIKGRLRDAVWTFHQRAIPDKGKETCELTLAGSRS